MVASQDTFREIITTFAELLSEHKEAFQGARLVLPNAAFFPDKIDVSPDGLRTLFQRVLSYSPVPQDVPFELGFVEDESAKSCSSGACGPEGATKLLPAVLEQDDAYVIPLDVQIVKSPVRLTASLARSAGGLLLAYTGREVTGPRAELAGVLSGLGAILLNGSHIYMKGCGGVKLMSATELSASELAAALAIFVHLFELSPREARSSMQPTQDELFTESLAFMKTQPQLVQKLREAPELLAGGAFEFESPKGFLGGMFGLRSRNADSGIDGAGTVARVKRTPEQQARLAEARQLVEEVGLFNSE
jgi:hypothetical protein